MLNEVKALRAGYQLGWRDQALANLGRLAVMPTPRRDLVELRTEAVASIGEFGVKELARFEGGDAPPGGGWCATSLDFSPDSKRIASASKTGDVDLWDVPNVTQRRRIADAEPTNEQHTFWDRGRVHFLSDGDLAYITKNGRVAFLGAPGRQSARSPIERGNARALKLGIDRQGGRLAVGWTDGRIDLHDAGTGLLQRSFEWKNPWDFAFSSDGQWLALQGKGGPIEMVPTSGQGTAFSLGHRSGYFAALAFGPDGAVIAGVDGRSVVLWDLASKQELLRQSGHKESVTAIAFSPDGSLVATSCGDSMTRIWDARDGRALAALPGPWYMRSLAFSPDGQYLAASTDPGPVCLYQLEGRREQRRLVGHKFGTLAVAFHPSLPRLASSSDDHSIIVWDADAARLLGRWIGHKRQVTGLAYSPDGSLLASTCGSSSADELANDHGVHLWNAGNGKLWKRLPRPSHQGVWTLAFDPAGRRLASGDEGGTVLIWEVESGRTVRCEREGNSRVASVAFHNAGRQLFVGLETGEVSLFDLEPSGPARRIHLPDGCRRLVVDIRRNRAVVGGSTGAVTALSLPDLGVALRLAKGHDGPIASLAVTRDGRLLATSGMDRRVVLRDAETFRALLTFPAWTGVVRELAFDVSGRWLALAGADSDVSLWDLRMVHDELAALGLAWDQEDTHN
jgi:WD40 repeat protein